jgi:hypothetical protein
MLTDARPESSPFSIQPPSQSSPSVRANSYTLVDAMQVPRAFIAMLVLVAAVFAPVISVPLECVVIPSNPCNIG